MYNGARSRGRRAGLQGRSDDRARSSTTMPDFVDHIVIVDDCSPDATSEVVRAIAIAARHAASATR